jgi:uncharacterized repeat protein (TIGR01451 family)
MKQRRHTSRPADLTSDVTKETLRMTALARLFGFFSPLRESAGGQAAQGRRAGARSEQASQSDSLRGSRSAIHLFQDKGSASMRGRGSEAARSPVVMSAAERSGAHAPGECVTRGRRTEDTAMRGARRTLTAAVGVVAVLGAGAFLAVPQAQAAAPAWKLTVAPDATYFAPGTPADPDEEASYTIEAENVGGATSNADPITIEDVLPSGFTAVKVHFFETAVGYERETKNGPSEDELNAFGACPTALRCIYPSGSRAGALPAVNHREKLVMQVDVGIPPGFAQGPIEDLARISGGGAASAQATVLSAVEANPPFAFDGLFGSLSSTAATEPSTVAPFTQAGGHPYQVTTEMNFATIAANKASTEEGELIRSVPTPIRDPRDIAAELPPGLIGNPQAVPHCSLADFFARDCPLSTVVGDVGIRYGSLTGSSYLGGFSSITPVYNLQPTGSYPGELGYTAQTIPFLVTFGLRSGSDYGLTATGTGTEEVGVNRVRFNIWGVPADPSHDALRGKSCSLGELWSERHENSPESNEQWCIAHSGYEGGFVSGNGGPAGVPPVPFLTMPTRCSAQPLSLGARSTNWEVPGEEATAATALSGVEGCDELHFEPTIEAHPTTNLADSPSGFDFALKVPQEDNGPEGKESPTGRATADLKEAVVTLPPGLVVNPSSGAGLEGCSPAQVGLTTPVGTSPAHFTESPAQCPEASKLGTVEVKTPLLHEPLGSIEPLPGRVGAVYLATPHQNPSGSLLAGYIVLEGEGLIIKLAGQFQTNPQTGQITASFTENPQTPFGEFRFHFFEGAKGALRTPAVCGTYEVHSTLTPWSAPESGPPAQPTSEFETSAGPTGGSCPKKASSEPSSPRFEAGTESPAAGVYSPFSLKLVRQDGEQEIKGIETTLPEGLVGRLAGTSYCPDAALAAAAAKSGVAEQQSPSCPSSSEVGTVDVTAGAGPTPLQVPGRAYLAGPYKGAPLSLAIITPAVAGPFDLGTVVVRTALLVDPLTTQITAKSDPIPTILEGIPLDVRSITLQMAKPRFTLNPTSCEPKQITGTALTSLGASASLSQRFQVGGCPALPFKPSLAISLKGSTRHAGHPALKAVLTYPQGGPYANVAEALVNLPHSEFIDQGNLDKTCTRPVLLEGACPASTVYGKAKAWTPLLEKPLEGPVYLVGGFGYKLPALVAELDGQIKVLLVGRVDSGKNHGIRNTFEAVPDAPVEKFVLEMKGGSRYSLLENSEDLCARPQKAIASFTAQSGKVLDLHPTVANDCGKKGKGHKGRKHRGGHGGGDGKGGRGASGGRALAALIRRGW